LHGGFVCQAYVSGPNFLDGFLGCGEVLVGDRHLCVSSFGVVARSVVLRWVKDNKVNRLIQSLPATIPARFPKFLFSPCFPGFARFFRDAIGLACGQQDGTTRSDAGLCEPQPSATERGVVVAALRRGGAQGLQFGHLFLSADRSIPQ
jgi:hypothetical protein